MRYLKFKNSLKEYTVFSLNDIRKIDSNFRRRQLNEWQDKGYIRKIVKGYYIFSDRAVNEDTLYRIANKIYRPSYVSLEIALSHYSLIPESVYSVTSVSTKRTYNFSTPVGGFTYRTLKPELFFGYHIVRKNDDTPYKIAAPEKALLDYLYLNPHYDTLKDYRELRISSEMFWESIEEKKLLSYVEKFGQKKLKYRVEKLLRYLKND